MRDSWGEQAGAQGDRWTGSSGGCQDSADSARESDAMQQSCGKASLALPEGVEGEYLSEGGQAVNSDHTTCLDECFTPSVSESAA